MAANLGGLPPHHHNADVKVVAPLLSTALPLPPKTNAVQKKMSWCLSSFEHHRSHRHVDNRSQPSQAPRQQYLCGHHRCHLLDAHLQVELQALCRDSLQLVSVPSKLSEHPPHVNRPSAQPHLQAS